MDDLNLSGGDDDGADLINSRALVVPEHWNVSCDDDCGGSGDDWQLNERLGGEVWAFLVLFHVAQL